jgi:hypothetical protein
LLTFVLGPPAGEDREERWGLMDRANEAPAA